MKKQINKETIYNLIESVFLKGYKAGLKRSSDNDDLNRVIAELSTKYDLNFENNDIPVVRIYNEAKDIFEDSNLSWEGKFDFIFSSDISGKVNHLFEWYDPDTTYEEDVTAFMNAFKNYLYN